MQKLYFRFEEGDADAVLELFGASNVPSTFLKDVYYDFDDHRLLKGKERLWICRRTTKSSNDEDAKELGRNLCCKLVKSDGHDKALSFEMCKLSDQPVRKLLCGATVSVVTQRPLAHEEQHPKCFSYYARYILTNAFASIDFMRKQADVRLTGNVPCTISLDVCTSKYFPGTYCVGSLAFRDAQARDSKELTRLIPDAFEVEFDSNLNAKVLHSLLFTNPFLYNVIKFGKSPEMSARTLALIEESVFDVTSAIALQKRRFFRNAVAVRAGHRKLQILRVLRHSAYQQLRSAQHSIPSVFRVHSQSRNAFQELKDSEWGRRHFVSCIAHWELFYRGLDCNPKR